MRVVFVFMNCKVWYFWKCLKSPLELPCTATVGTFIEGTNYFNLRAHFTQLCYGKIQNETLKTPLFPSVYVLRVWVVPRDTRKRDNRSHRQPWVSVSTENPGPPRSSAHNRWVISRQGLPTPGFLAPWLRYSLSFLLHSLSFADESVSYPTPSPVLKWSKGAKKWTATLRKADSVWFVSSENSTWNKRRNRITFCIENKSQQGTHLKSSWAWWHWPVTSAPQEAEARGFQVQGLPGQASEALSLREEG